MRYVFVLMMLTVWSCDKDDTIDFFAKARSACSSELSWLKEIITKADEDKATKKYQGNYMGKIYLTTYNGSPAFLVSMMMGSGGLAYYVFDCAGSRLYPVPPGNGNRDEFSYKAINDNNLVYSNMP
jgi:hypothetical protein